MDIPQIRVTGRFFVPFVEQTIICQNVQLKRKKVTQNVGIVEDSMLVVPTNVNFFSMLKKLKITQNQGNCFGGHKKAI